MEAFLGTILTVGFPFAPVNWAQCQGQLLQVNQNAALFSLFSTLYGGNGSSTFGLPDLRSRTPFGAGTGTSLPPYNVGDQVGVPQTTLSTANMPAHTHAATFAPTTTSQTVTIPAQTGTLAVTMNALTSAAGTQTTPASNLMLAAGTKIYGTAPTVPPTPPAGTVALAPASTTVTGNAPTAQQSVSFNTVTGGTVTNAAVGGSQPFSTMQPSLALNFIVALSGIYPTRS